MMPDIEFITSMFGQLPLVAIFLWFVLQRDKKLKEHDDEWRGVIEKIQAQQNESMKEFSSALDVLAEQIAKSTATLILHDATCKGENSETIGSARDIMEKIYGSRK